MTDYSVLAKALRKEIYSRHVGGEGKVCTALLKGKFGICSKFKNLWSRNSTWYKFILEISPKGIIGQLHNYTTQLHRDKGMEIYNYFFYNGKKKLEAT